jgi:hypothetical protein
MTLQIPEMLQHGCEHATSLSWASNTATPPPANAMRLAVAAYLLHR